MVYADFLGAEFLDAKDLFVLDVKDNNFLLGSLNFSKSARKIKNNKKIQKGGRFVVPGFYGETENGSVALFSRGGSDLSGAYLAYFLNYDIYENFTDFPILTADPRIIKNPIQIKKITHRELRDLTYSGFSILHKDVILPLLEKGIPTEIRSTSAFPDKGTLTVIKRTAKEKILAVTGMKNFFILQIWQDGLNEIQCITADILNILKKNKIPIEHISTGIDDISIILENKYLDQFKKTVIQIKKRLDGNSQTEIKIKKNIGLLCISGKGMKNEIGILAKITTVLSQAGINIISINQASSERNIICFIDNKNINKAIKEIYYNFIK